MKKFDQKLALFLIGFVFLAGFAGLGFIYAKKSFTKLNEVKSQVEEISKNIVPSSDAPSSTPIVTDSEKDKISKSPPKHKEIKNATTTQTSTSQDGSKTTIVSDGSIDSTELQKIVQSGSGGSSPSNIKFTDETTRYPELEKVIKDYLSTTLRWGSEVSSLYQIIVRDAGDTGWSGQYAGSYNTNSSGKIVSAYGVIYLNTSYYKNMSNSEVDQYMKLVFSHEYGHHYSLYHKWVDLNLPMGTRFPDQYYNVRPLSKSSVDVDCTNWKTCEAEVVAEDYSYFYSGFHMDQMSDTLGYPSDATKTWLDSLINLSSSQSSSTQVNQPEPQSNPVIDNPPTIIITSPEDSAIILNTIGLSANASDDHAVLKVSFYIDNKLIGEDASAPYELSFDTTLYSNGQHSLKISAYDSSSKTDATNSLTIKNMPTISILNPTPNPYIWDTNLPALDFQVRTGSYVPVEKTKIYLDNELVADVAYGNFNFSIKQNELPAGQHIFKFNAFDDDGNMAETSITINKL